MNLSFGCADLVIREVRCRALSGIKNGSCGRISPIQPFRLNKEALMKALAITAVLLSALLAQAPSSPQPAAAYTYQGTVQAVHPKTVSFDLVIGVGYALRVVHMRTSPVTQFESDGARLSLTDLKPGDIVRAECRMTATGLVADRVEKVEPSDSKQEPIQ
jgi:hypothetical protein